MSNQTCQFCKGQGVVTSPSGLYQKCPICDGSGKAAPVEELFEYGLTFLNVAGNGAFSGSATITDADFEWQYAMAVATGPFTITVTDGGTKQPFSNIPVHQNVLFGNAQNPMALLRAHTFKRMGSIYVQGNDISGAANNIYLGFLGVQKP